MELAIILAAIAVAFALGWMWRGRVEVSRRIQQRLSDRWMPD